MTTSRKLILFVMLGFGAVMVATQLPALNVQWRGVMLLSGGWLMAVGILYQVKLYAEQKDVLYYALLVFAGIIWLSMMAIILYLLGILIGVV